MPESTNENEEKIEVARETTPLNDAASTHSDSLSDVLSYIENPDRPIVYDIIKGTISVDV